ncbi:unnamed protein product [Cylicocyclus nassatus]|uniref:Transthyretin-like family protein n=1 Tax=Cylicocyclus nassatus TaxID=53992 RepID=A0AA36MHB4_CYLNA|nr:unnamed protein product [Cylicocyclus nassatus]
MQIQTLRQSSSDKFSMSNILCLVLFAAVLIVFAGAHRITVRGTFYCDKNPNAVVLLELREKDILEEDLLNWKLVDGNGDFEIDGHDDELFSFQPYLRIRHNCNSEPMEFIRSFGVRRGAVTVDLEQVHLEEEED